MPPAASLLRNRPFALLWVSQTLSLLGTSVSALAYPLLVLQSTGSAAQAGLVTAALSATVLLLKLPAGRLVDARPGMRPMLVADAVRALALAGAAASVAAGHVSVAIVVAVSVVEAAAGVVFAPAEFRLQRQVVAPAQRGEAVARSQARSQFAGLLGPSVGGALYAVDPALPFAADAASYLLSLLLVLGVRALVRGDAPAPPRSRAVGGPSREAWRWLRAQRGLWLAAWWTAALTATFTAVGFVLLTLARSRGASPGELGVLYTLSAAGGVGGALATPWIQRHWSGSTVLRAAAWVDAAATLALLPDQSPYVTGAIGLGAFLLVPAVGSVLLGRLATDCPDRLVGRAQATLTLAMGAFVPVAAPSVGLVADWAGPRAAVTACAAVFLVLAAVATGPLPDVDAR